MRLSPLLSALTLGACATVLGIEDIHDGPAPGDGGDTSSGATSSTGGKSSIGGKTGTGASTPMGGEDTGVGGALVTGNEGGSTGMGGAPPIEDPTVRGKVIDFWGQAVPGVPVQIGETLVQTDAMGEFELADVADEYDISLSIELNSITLHGYVFQGLTRRDPTLQVYKGLTDRSGNFLMQGHDVTVGTNQVALMSIGGPGGAAEYTAYEGGLDTSFYWRGASAIQATAHALYWQTDAATDLPTSYLGFDSTLVAFDDSTPDKSNFSFMLSGDPLTSGNLQGTVTPSSDVDRENYAFLRFATGDRIQLLKDYPNGPNTFSYLVPTVTGGSITMAAVEGYAYTGDYAVAHQSGLAASGTVNLTIPNPGSLVAPNDSVTNVNLTTQFSYLGGTGSAGTHLVAIHADERVSCCFDILWIATTKTQLTLPEVVGANFLKSSELYYWRIETHGKYATVDAMTGPAGFLDSFSADEASPQGPRTGSGQYSVTSSRRFTAAP
ncbi:MAG TPA: hypothetical protein VJN18_17830 [Polyangiaceae bacterium]|nr:hypothetical protein [Polyangiaceae bacterium]